MKVIEMLKKAGARAGLLQVAQEVNTIEIKIVDRKIVSLKELHTHAAKQDLSEVPPELTVGFDRVFEAMNLPAPEHGWSHERIREMMDSEELKAKPAKEVAEAVLVALGQNQVKPDDVIKDAVSRDKALDSYEQFLQKKLLELAGSRKTAVSALKQQMKDCEQQIEKLEASQSRDEKTFRDWQAQKNVKEQELARVASLFLENHGITVGNNENKK